jgi:hypothetical protein
MNKGEGESDAGLPDTGCQRQRLPESARPSSAVWHPAWHLPRIEGFAGIRSSCRFGKAGSGLRFLCIILSRYLSNQS